MNYETFVGICPFELGDKVALILDKDNGVISNEIYTVSDILTTHSCKNGNLTFKVIVKDWNNRDLAKRQIDSIKLLK